MTSQNSSDEGVREVPEVATFTIGGELANMQTQPGEARYGECLCCRPRGHVFWYGVHLPFEVAGASGPTAASPADWLYRVLRPYRFESGRRVRLTVEVLAPAAPEPVAALPANQDQKQQRGETE